MLNQPEEKKITLFLAGDSTMADKNFQPSNPEKGWGQVFPLYLTDDIMVKNHAVNGRSTKSFRKEGRWNKIMKQVKKGDYVLVQFGHNDQKKEDPKRYSDPVNYKENLRQFVKEIQQKNAIAILATPIARRSFDENGNLIDTHLDYSEQVRLLAEELNIPMLDLNKKTEELILAWGQEASKDLFLHFSPGQYERFPDGVVDNTHLSPLGAFKICDLVVEEIKIKVPEFTVFLRK